jgi:L-2-hydroxyglutarate oxidase LhgO
MEEIAGIYYPPGTLKARTCVEGNSLLYEICEKNNVACNRLGKLIVATDEKEAEDLEVLLKRGCENGVEKLKIIDRNGIKELEPHIEGIAALYSPNTGVVDSHGLMSCFLRMAKSRNADIAYGVTVVGMDKLGTGYKVSVLDSDGTPFSFVARTIINCAGLGSDRVAEMVGIDIEKAGYGLKFCKGDYFSVGNSKNKLIGRLVYPVPSVDGTGLGIHATLDTQGRLRLGPDDSYMAENKQDYSIDDSKGDSFYQSAGKLFPFIERDDLTPEMSGIRPKLQGPDEEFRDFVIQDEEEKGVAGFINLVGIESPGLTAAPAIAKYVNELIRN